MRLLWVVALPLIAIGFNMALPKLPKMGAMRSKMLKVKSLPSLKMGGMKTKIGPKTGSPSNALMGHAINRGEMM